jgi:thioredoxin-dependent peroxiredoxin
VIQPGEAAPDFDLPTSQGGRLRLSSLRGKPVILYFFPKAFTYGCTVETEAFAQRYPDLRAQGVEVVGVSVDDASTQSAFASKCQAIFPLVADEERTVARAYGTLGLLGMARRVTFVLDAHGTVREVIESLRPGPHLVRAITAALQSASRPA